jgi:hypothetical protein
MKEGAHDFISQKEIHELNRMGKTLGMKDMAFQKDTLFVLRSARKLLCKNGTQKDIDCLREYEEKYPDSYRFTIPRESPKKLRFLRFLLLLILRENPKYRLTDKILLSSWCMKTILFISGKLFQKHMPPFVNKQCMDIKTVLVT